MPLSTNFNVSPYYDDYDETSSYYRILFRPGYAVQARELTQLQTILQKQIERYGQHMFKEGSKVFGGEVSLDTEVKSLKLETQEGGLNVNAASFVGATIVGANSNARARVVASQATTTSTQPTLMFHYLSGDSFDDGEVVASTTAQATTVSAAGASGITGAVANGSVVSVDTGVFYVGGFFLFTPANTIVMEAYSSTPSGRVGLQITESTKTSDDDNTLLDPASGTYNFAAPGAARYKIELALKSKALTATDPVLQLADENFIQLLKVIEGVKNEEVKYPMYGELEKTLARRTFDESGDYTVTPFNLDLQIHRGLSGTTAASGVDGTTVYGNNTLFETEIDVGDKIYLGSNTTTSTVTAIANNTRLTVQTTLATNTPGSKIYNESEISAGMDAGKAYVKGYEYESIDTHYIDVDKGRDEDSVASYSTSSEVGNYLVVDTANGVFDVAASEVVQLHSVKRNNINVTSNTALAATQVGTARVRSMDWDTSSGNSAAADTNHSNYRLYLWDVNTSNNITGSVAEASSNTRIIQLDTPSTSYVNGAYTGASITVNTKVGIDSTNDVRIIDDYYSNSVSGNFTTVMNTNSASGDTQTIGVVRGMGVSGPGIPAGAVVRSVNIGTSGSFTIDSPSFNCSTTSGATAVTTANTTGLVKDQAIVAENTLSCNTTNLDATVKAQTSTLATGMSVVGTGIPSSTTIASITDGETFELSAAATATATGVTVTFSPLAGSTLIDSVTNSTSFVLSTAAIATIADVPLKRTPMESAGSNRATTFSRHFVVANSVLGQATNYNVTATNARTTYEIDFKIKDVESVVTSSLSSTLPLNSEASVNSSADVSDPGKYNNSPSGNTILGATDKNTLVFPLPQSPIKKTTISGNTVSYMFKKVSKSLTSDASGKLSITLPNFRFMPSLGSLTRNDARENFIVVVKSSKLSTATNDAQTFVNAVSSSGTLPNNDATVARKLANGQFLDLGSINDAATAIRPTVISNERKTVDINCNTNAAFIADVIYTVESSAIDKEPGPRTKTLVSGNASAIVARTGGEDTDPPTSSVAEGQFYIETPNQRATGTDTIPVSDAFNLVKVVDSGQPFIHVTNEMMTATANNIANRYTFETGQKDNFYDHATIKLKPGYSGPKGKIMIVVDYFDWDGGEGYHAVDSYPTSGSYNKVDDASTLTFNYGVIPDFTSPATGETVNLRDCLDFRPRRENESNDLTANTRAVEGIPTPDPEGTITAGFSYYLSRVDKIALTKDRKFKILRGESALNPVAPPDDEDSMTLYSLTIPAYTFNLSDITTRYIDNKRFTMRDIGKLEKRIERIEYYTSLTILEKETAARNFSTGASRDSLFNPTGTAFKNGILVDSFNGHSVGDVMSDDYNVSIEYATKRMRPGFYYDDHKFTYSLAYSNNVTKTGDLVTLPYTDTDFIIQPFSSTTQALNPFNITNWIGSIKTFPASDTWFSQGARPDVTTNLEGQNDNWTLSPASGRTGFGSQYDDWSTNWTGKQVTEQPQAGVDKVGKIAKANRSTTEMNDSKSRIGISANTPPESVIKTIGNKTLDSTVVPYVRGQTVQFAATGLQPFTNVYVYFSETDVSASVRPASKITLTSVNNTFQVGETLRDAANNYATVLLASNTTTQNTATIYISNVTGNNSSTQANKYGVANSLPEGLRETFPGTIGTAAAVFPVANTVEGLTSTAQGTINTRLHNEIGVANGIMKTDVSGQIAGELYVSDATWRSGNKLLRVTDSALNNVAATVTASESTFGVKGILQNREQLIISTRETINQRELPNDEAIVRDTTTRSTEKTNWINPTCQTFHVDPNAFPKGLFLRNVTLNFYSKDTYLPVTLQIRPIVNGFPSASKVLPFSEVVLDPDRVQVSTTANASVANTTTRTTFTFDSPVYLSPDEYAIVVTSNSPDYVLHLAEEGATSSGSVAKISKPPFVGSFFKPQNSGIWEAQPNKYVMFNMQRADFTVGAGGNTNFAKFISHSNSAASNTANVMADKIKVGTSTIDFSDTSVQWKYAASNGTFTLADGTEGSADYVVFSPDQNYELIDRKRLVYGSNGSFRIRAEMTSANSHVSPVIDLDRLNVVSIENNIDDAGLSDPDFSVSTPGSGYVNVAPSAYTAAVVGGGTTNTATVNVHVELVMNVVSQTTPATLLTSNTTHNLADGYRFVVGDAVMCNTSTNAGATDSGVFGIVSDVTVSNTLDPKSNVTSVTIKTNANNSTVPTGGGAGAFKDGVLIWANANAMANVYGQSATEPYSNTKMIVNKANGYVSNVVIHTAGSGYVQNPTITMATVSGTGSINAAVQCTGEERNSGGPIAAKYISRRVTLKDGFDASDLKVILNAYKPLGTNIHLYYKIKNADDPDDFDLKDYTLMTQETSSGTVSKGKEDIQEFIYKTPSESVAYTSNKVRYETFKTFAIKIALVANTYYDMPKVKDMRAIALD